MSPEKEAIQVTVAAGVVVKRDGKYLLVQESQKHCYGKWNFPAGTVDQGETIEEAAVREAKEESGFDVRIIRKIDIYHEKATAAVKHAFEAEIIGGELSYPKDELMGAGWFSYNEIVAMKENLRNPWILDAIANVEQR